MIPACIVARAGFWLRLAMLTPATMTWFFFGMRADHLAGLAAVFPRQDLDGVALVDLHSNHLRCEADDAHEPLVAKLASDRAEDAGAARL